MANELDPVVGNWYCHRAKGQLFRIVAIDEDRWIEIQRFDGDLDECDPESWAALDLEPAEPPEDWTGPVDDLDPEDCGYTDSCMCAADWRSATGEYPEGREAWEPDEDEAELDDHDDAPGPT